MSGSLFAASVTTPVMRAVCAVDVLQAIVSRHAKSIHRVFLFFMFL